MKTKITALCFGTLAIAFVVGVMNPIAGKQACTNVWSSYATAVNAGDLETAHALHSARYRKKFPFQEFTNRFHITSGPGALYGGIQHYHSSPVLSRASFAVSSGQLMLPVRWEDGIIPIVTMAKQDGEWRIDDLTIQAQ